MCEYGGTGKARYSVPTERSSSGEQGKQLTDSVPISTAGNSISPIFIFPRKR